MLTLEQLTAELEDVTRYLKNRDKVIADVENGRMLPDAGKFTILSLNNITEDDLVTECLAVDFNEILEKFDTGSNVRIEQTARETWRHVDNLSHSIANTMHIVDRVTKQYGKQTDNIIHVRATTGWYFREGYKEVANDAIQILQAINQITGKSFKDAIEILKAIPQDDGTPDKFNAGLDIEYPYFNTVSIATTDLLHTMQGQIGTDECAEAGIEDIHSKSKMPPSSDLLTYMHLLLNKILIPLGQNLSTITRSFAEIEGNYATGTESVN